MPMVYVPGGEFVMGSGDEEVDYALRLCQEYDTNCRRRYFSVESPTHTVFLDSFWIDQTEVTNNQYGKCVEKGACDQAGCPEESGPENGEHPVVCVTWQQAAAYCAWAGGQLPTEAEWEYAARGTGGSRYPWGDEFDGTLLNYCDINCTLGKRDETVDDGYVRTAPVGSYPGGASWVGALDMAGNVWEIVADWNGAYSPERQINPKGPESGSRRVARGGSWHTSPDHVRSALRTHVGPNDSVNHAGFRCAQPHHLSQGN
jgi:formylglycine-generating enzyme required for sulfatase activity